MYDTQEMNRLLTLARKAESEAGSGRILGAEIRKGNLVQKACLLLDNAVCYQRLRAYAARRTMMESRVESLLFRIRAMDL